MKALSFASLGLAFRLGLWTTHAAAAGPSVQTLFPAGAQRGQTVQVKATGAFAAWPPKVWVDRKGVDVKPAKDKGKLDVTVAADATPGVYYLRFYNEQGASAVRPFIVGQVEEIREAEPNDDPQKPQQLSSTTVTVNGVLSKTGDVDTFAISVKKGQTLVASLEGNSRLGSPMDAILQVVSSEGFVLDQNDDDHGLDPQLAYVAPRDGVYLVRTFAFPAKPNSSIRFAGSSTYVYRLTITTGGFVDYTLPLAVSCAAPARVKLVGWNLNGAAEVELQPAADQREAVLVRAGLANSPVVLLEDHATMVEQEPNDAASAQDIEAPTTVSGLVQEAGDVDVFQFKGVKGQRWQFRSESRSLGYPLDSYLELLDVAGKVLARNDDATRGQADAVLTYTLPKDGAYRIAIRDLYRHGGRRYAYRLSIREARPDFQLTLAADSFTLTPEKPLEIPVGVARLERFAEEIEITVEGLPEGVSVEPVKSLAKGATAKSVKLKLTTGGKAASGPIRIVGRSTGKTPITRTAKATVAGLTVKLPDVWLTSTTAPAKSK